LQHLLAGRLLHRGYVPLLFNMKNTLQPKRTADRRLIKKVIVIN
jgi:hypothetical protein